MWEKDKLYSLKQLQKSKEAAILEGKISAFKMVNDEFTKLYNIMLANSDNREVVSIVLQRFF